MFKQNFHIIAFWFGRGFLVWKGHFDILESPAPACPFGEEQILIRSNNVAIVAPPILQIIWKSESSKYLPLDKEFTNPRFECFNARGFQTWKMSYLKFKELINNVVSCTEQEQAFGINTAVVFLQIFTQFQILTTYKAIELETFEGHFLPKFFAEDSMFMSQDHQEC